MRVSARGSPLWGCLPRPRFSTVSRRVSFLTPLIPLVCSPCWCKAMRWGMSAPPRRRAFSRLRSLGAADLGYPSFQGRRGGVKPVAFIQSSPWLRILGVIFLHRARAQARVRWRILSFRNRYHHSSSDKPPFHYPLSFYTSPPLFLSKVSYFLGLRWGGPRGGPPPKLDFKVPSPYFSILLEAGSYSPPKVSFWTTHIIWKEELKLYIYIYRFVNRTYE